MGTKDGGPSTQDGSPPTEMPGPVSNEVMRRGCVCLIVLSAACASAPIKPKTQALIGLADGLVLQGCYDCLFEARDIYEKAAVGKARPLLVARLFETDVLMALRERELVLDASSAFAKARALVPELPATYGAPDYLAIAEAIPGDVVGVPRAEANAFRRAHVMTSATTAAWRASLESGAASAPFRQYLLFAFDCTSAGRSPITEAQRPPLPDAAPPLLRYRHGNCTSINAKELDDVLAAEPRFVEAGAFAARLQTSRVTPASVARARELLGPAYARFPRSPVVTFELARLHHTLADFPNALIHYDETLAIAPNHEDAWLQKTIVLTYLKETDHAIAVATAIIDRGLDTKADAFYWRAVNYYDGKNLALARADINVAKSLRVNVPIYVLAGMIEHDQDDLDIAERDLRVALTANSEACTALWYLALVQLKRQAWPKSADFFASAMPCYEGAATTDERSIATMRASDVDPGYKAVQILSLEKSIAESRSQQSAAAFNAAVNYLRAGDRKKATSYADLAEKDPQRAAAVLELRKLIEKAGGGRNLSKRAYSRW